MKKRTIIPAIAGAVCLAAFAMNDGGQPARNSKTEISAFNTHTAVLMRTLPVFGRSTDTYKDTPPLDLYVTPEIDALTQSADTAGVNLHILTFDIENRSFTAAAFTVEGTDDYALYCDGDKVTGKHKLHPGTHRMTLKYTTDNASAPDVKVLVETDSAGVVTHRTDGKRIFTLDDVMCGEKVRRVEMSADGRYLLAGYDSYLADGSGSSFQRLFDTRTGRAVRTLERTARWMPRSAEYYMERRDYKHGRMLVAVDPATGAERILATHIPDGHFSMAPTEDFLIYSLYKEGQKEKSAIYEVVDPEDRQPGYRSRSYPAIYRFDTGVLTPVAGGNAGVYCADVADDGSKLLLMVSRQRFTERPTTLTSIMTLDLSTFEVDTIVADDGFVSSACFTPDGRGIAVTGGPEAFGRIGCTLADSIIPSTYDNQLFIVDLADRSVRALTRDFDPSINDIQGCAHDGRLYLTVTERDRYRIYAVDPASGKISLIETPETAILAMDCAYSAPMVAFVGQSASNPSRLYTQNTRTGKTVMLDAPSDDRLADVQLGDFVEWNFVNSRGDTIYGGYYLPDNFDPEKKYPLIVNYYGGCSPSTRLFESRYPFHVYAPLGYVVYVVNPSGATGFGQEFSSRHVSTAGKGVAEDIIEGTEKFIADHGFVDRERVGCIGASYGGFMTQYLQTQTDLFAAAISHAGISDHTSYWGEGYWGYSYSETSMGNDKPWTATDLYVQQSPLYNADKIKTPILFLHGDSDTNVPPGESIQMFTALKLLGVPTALVMVNGENHHINNFEKRRLWQDTILAWFARYLQGDNAWWYELYPDKEL